MTSASFPEADGLLTKMPTRALDRAMDFGRSDRRTFLQDRITKLLNDLFAEGADVVRCCIAVLFQPIAVDGN